MKNNFHTSVGLRSGSLAMRSALQHARIAGRLTQANAHPFSASLAAQNSFGSFWSPLRLDLLKTPLTRHRET